jgi:hypothetical protein
MPPYFCVVTSPTKIILSPTVILTVILQVILQVILAGCGAGVPVRVLPAQAVSVQASLGGPIVPESVPTVLVPYLTAGAAYGLTDEITLHGNAHLTMTAFAVAGLDLGASARVLRQDGAIPEVTAGLRALMFTDFVAWNTSRLYPDLHVNASWEVWERALLYAGTHVTFQWKPGATFVSPMLGLQFPVSDKISLLTELIWQAANVNTEGGIFKGRSSINGTGSFGGFIGGVLWL